MTKSSIKIYNILINLKNKSKLFLYSRAEIKGAKMVDTYTNYIYPLSTILMAGISEWGRNRRFETGEKERRKKEEKKGEKEKKQGRAQGAA